MVAGTVIVPHLPPGARVSIALPSTPSLPLSPLVRMFRRASGTENKRPFAERNLKSRRSDIVRKRQQALTSIKVAGTAIPIFFLLLYYAGPYRVLMYII